MVENEATLVAREVRLGKISGIAAYVASWPNAGCRQRPLPGSQIVRLLPALANFYVTDADRPLPDISIGGERTHFLQESGLVYGSAPSNVSLADANP